MKTSDKKAHTVGIWCGLTSGLTYGIYTTLIMVAGYYQPLAGAVGLLAAPYVCSGLNDLFAGIWLAIYNAKCKKLKEVPRCLKTKTGKLIVLGALLGGPVANGAYLIGLSMAGAYAIPISATCSIFGALFSWIFLKEKPTKRIIAGMLICVAGAIIINWVKPEGSPNFTLGIICAVIAAVCWGLEGMISSFGGEELDPDVSTNLRELVSGIVDLAIIVPVVGAIPLLCGTFKAVTPVLWILVAGLAAAISFLTWYKGNALVGCAISMSLNVTYAFWGVLFCVLFLGQELTVTIVTGCIVIIIGAILVTMNPLDLFRKKSVEQDLA